MGITLALKSDTRADDNHMGLRDKSLGTARQALSTHQHHPMRYQQIAE